jgi:serine phosphatase RsbU (regulator of sigma subunit)
MSDEVILVVDDEIANLQKLRRTFINRYPVLSAVSGREALSLVLQNDGIAVIIADQRMPDMTGVELLSRTLDYNPDAIRIILTGFTDVDVLMEAINRCKVFRYIVKPWDPPDLLMTVERGLEARQLATENARIRKELIRRERLAHELEIASKIQRYILPTHYPALEGYQIAVEYHPAREVGGDLYDFEFNADEQTLQVIIGDVSGKSIPAALYGAVFSGQMRSLFSHAAKSPSDTLKFLNSSLIARYPVSNYIAVTYLRLDLNTGDGCIANGGMPYPYYVHRGTVSQLNLTGTPLALMEEVSYDDSPIRLEKGDTLILVSDGTMDAVSPSGEMFEAERLLQSIRAHCSEELNQFVKGLYQEIAAFAGNAELSDDITILAIRRGD